MQKKTPGLSRNVAVLIMVVASACSKKAPQPQAPSSPAAPVGIAPVDKGTPPAPTGKPRRDVDLGKLDEHARKLFDQVVDREPSACGKGHSLRYSLEHDGDCQASFYAVRYVAHLAAAGLAEPEIVEKLEQRFRTARLPYIDVSQAPSKGAPAGRVTVVEFADYECDHCKLAQPIMQSLVHDYPKDVTVYFKHFPLGGHVNAANAALGAAGAQLQGKFWQFNDKVWESSEHLSPALLEGIAKEVGLDFARWYADLSTEAVRSHVMRDRTEGRTLEIRRTPAIFINGRRYTDDIELAALRDWIDEELGR